MADVECESGVETCGMRRGRDSRSWRSAGRVSGQPGGESTESSGSLAICGLLGTCGGWQSRGARRPVLREHWRNLEILRGAIERVEAG